MADGSSSFSPSSTENKTRGPDKEGYSTLSYSLSETYVVGTQKNRLIETILLSTHKIGLEDQIRILEHAKHSISRALKNKNKIM